ncbi:glycosyltransferase family 4 protein [uncultured Albimonas sp.]|uniref:glycosyltransferase family 4 protein n=1 Tax=uncultured Albimonas sp. TaxID=1331701 RepID=UPI0030EBE127
MAPGLTSIGASAAELDSAYIDRLFERFKPDAVISRLPHPATLEMARKREIPALPAFVHLFERRFLREWRFRRRLAHAIGGANVPCVANHSLNASRSVVNALGVSAEKVVPWDWSRIPVQAVAKPGPVDPAAPTAFYAGALSEEKGVGDCLEAMARLDGTSGPRLTMTFAGPGDLERWRQTADRLGLADRAMFLGSVPNDEVRQLMAAADMVVVPSRHAYAEGLPNTIYEGLASRSALLISDHPAFKGRLQPDRDCLEFRSSDPASLAAAVRRLCAEAELYATLSGHAPSALGSLYVGLPWTDLIERFVQDPTGATGWVGRHSLASIEAERAPRAS